MPVFWHTNPPESSASACFGSSLFILMNGRSFPDLLDFIRSDSAWLILLKSSSSLNSLTEMLLDTPLNTKNLLFEASAEWYDFGSDTLTFDPKTCFALQDSKILRSISYENPAFLWLLDLKNSEAWMVPPQFAHDSACCIKFRVNTHGNKWSPVFITEGGVVGWLAGGREGDPEVFLFLLAGV